MVFGPSPQFVRPSYSYQHYAVADIELLDRSAAGVVAAGLTPADLGQYDAGGEQCSRAAAAKPSTLAC